MTRQALVAAFFALLTVSAATAGSPPPVADLSIRLTDGVLTYTAGIPTTYTIVVENSGPSPVFGAIVNDLVTSLPQVEGATWTCEGAGGGTCTLGPVVGDLVGTADLPVGGTATYTLVVQLNAAATGNLINTATVAPPAGIADNGPRANTATDTDTHTPPVSDLSITMTDFTSRYTPGSLTTYTIVASNTGPDDAVGAVVADAVTSLPQVVSAVWTCVGAGGGSCAAAGAGAISDTVNLPVGGTVTYTLTPLLNIAAVGDLVNTATVTPAVGTTDPATGGNTATDTDTQSALLYVSPDGADVATCGPLATPCKTIQFTINLASAGNTIVAATGTYNECINLVPGGVAGTGAIRVESDELLASGTNASTIIDGTGVCDGVSPAPAGPVVTLHDGGELRGITIKGGGDSGVFAEGAVVIANNVITGNKAIYYGGGIHLETGLNLSDPSSKALIKSNSILSNTSVLDGGGIYAIGYADGVPSLVEIAGNTISANVSGGLVGNYACGGGIAAYSGTAGPTDNSQILITGNTIDGNIAKNATGGLIATGGGVCVETRYGSNPGTETVTIGIKGQGNAVRNNVSEGWGGGIAVSLQPPGGKHSVIIEGNSVTANTGKLGGGGADLYMLASDLTAGTSPNCVLRVSGNSFIGNHGQGNLLLDQNVEGGGGLHALLISLRTVEAAYSFELSGNTIQSNDSTTRGGGVDFQATANDDPDGDGATAPTDAVIWSHNNLIAKNAAHDNTAGGVSGGGEYGAATTVGGLAHATLSHDFLTVANNQTELDSGGLEWVDQRFTDSLGSTGTTTFTLSNSIVSGNDGYGVGGLVVPGPGTTIAVSYTDAFGNGSGDYQSSLGVDPAANGNISLDPSLDVSFLPRVCGPTIDKADPTIPATLEPLPNGGRVNMGHLGNTASATRTFPDINADGAIDGLDILAIAVSLSASSPSPRYSLAADRDLNGMIDGDDLAYVSAFYSQSCP